MSRSLADIKAGLSPERRARVEARAAQIIQEIEGLRPLRNALDQTQVELAGRLHISQASVAKMEKRTDLLLSTLRQYVEALGGQLSIVASFPGQPELRISGLGDIRPLGSNGHSTPAAARRPRKISA